MIKKLIITSLFLLNACTASALDTKDIYLKANVGASKLNSAKEIKQLINFNAKQHARISPSIGLAVGYNLNNDVRAEINAHIHSPHFDMSSSALEYVDNDNELQKRGAMFTKRKANIKTLMPTVYFTAFRKEDFYDIFLGGGIGIARIKEKVHIITTSNNTRHDLINPLLVETESSTTKVRNNLAYILTIGTNVKLQENVSVEFAYNWRDFGKTKPVSVDNDETPRKNRYKGHDFTVGLRLAL